MHYPEQLLHLMALLRRLPGVGAKTAERYAFQMISWNRAQLEQLGSTIAALPDQVGNCSECGALIGTPPCPFCDPKLREGGTICIVASPRDLYALEETRQYRGYYHVLNGLLSPLLDRGAEVIRVEPLRERIQRLEIREVIIALDSTLEGDATALYLSEQLSPLSVEVTRLAFGLPMGSPIDYVDGGTLTRALVGRRSLNLK